MFEKKLFGIWNCEIENQNDTRAVKMERFKSCIMNKMIPMKDRLTPVVTVLEITVK